MAARADLVGHRPVGPRRGGVRRRRGDPGRGGDRHGHGWRAGRQGGEVALPLHQLALSEDGAAAGLVARTHRGRRAVRAGREPGLDLQYRAAVAVDAGARAGDPGKDPQVAADRRLRQLHALRRDGHGLQHGVDHAAVRPADALLERRLPAALRNRPRLALRSAACRHADRPRARGCGRSHGAQEGDARRLGRARLLLRLPADGGLRAGRAAGRARDVGDGGLRPARAGADARGAAAWASWWTRTWRGTATP